MVEGGEDSRGRRGQQREERMAEGGEDSGGRRGWQREQREERTEREEGTAEGGEDSRGRRGRQREERTVEGGEDVTYTPHLLEDALVLVFLSAVYLILTCQQRRELRRGLQSCNTRPARDPKCLSHAVST